MPRKELRSLILVLRTYRSKRPEELVEQNNNAYFPKVYFLTTDKHFNATGEV
jgi:hypothetical protein